MKYLVFLTITAFTFSAYAQSNPEVKLKLDQVKKDSAEATKDQSLKTKAAEKTVKDSTSYKKVEKLVVTGSHIKRIDIEGPSPVVVIDQEAFKQSGNNTIEDVFRESPYFDSVISGGFYEGHARFHGQHAGNTLMLLNGMRLPKEAGGFYTSVSYIPTSALERVEILKDGSSAIYGSDAMAGVVNFITKEDADGGHAMVKFKTNEDGVGTEQSYVGSYGKSTNNSSFLLVGQYRKLDAYLETDVGGRSRLDTASYTKASRGSIGDTNIGPQDCAAKTDCETSRLIYSQIQPDVEDISALATGHYEFNNDLKITALGIYNHKTQAKSSRPLSIRGNGINYVAHDELGTYDIDKISDSMSVQTQLQKDFAETWDWKLQTSYSYQRVANETISGDANRAQVEAIIQQSSYNPAKSALAQSATFPTRKNYGQMINSKFIASGELLEIGEGSLSMAVGAEFERENFKFENDQSVVLDQNISRSADNFKGHRQVSSAFTELSFTPLRQIELQAAGRFDNYNDVGSTFNPKFALSYRPHQTVLFRSSYGTGFKPPGVSNMFTPSFVRNDSFFDAVNCPSDQPGCRQQREDVTVVRNNEITFETSTHYNLGVVFQPTRQLTFTLDNWHFEGKDTISNFRASHLTEFEKQYGNTDGLKALGGDIKRDASGNIISMQVPNVFNRAEKILRGIDLDIAYNDKFFIFKKNVSLGFKNTISHIYKRQERRFTFSPLITEKNSGTQNTATISGSLGNHYARFAARTLLNGTSDSADDNWDHPVYTEYDLTYSLATKKMGEFTIGLKNLLDDKPPIDERADDISYGRSASMFSPLGRRWFVSYAADF